MKKRIVESYRKKLASEEGFHVGHGELRIALCYPNTHAIGMANLGLHTMYELFNGIPGVLCERVFLPDPDELREYQRSGTPLLSLETQTPVKNFDVVAFTISFETDYLNMARILQMSGIPVWSKDRNHSHPLIVMGGAAFGAYAVLEHGGDFARAALALAEQGYGSASTTRRHARSAPPEPATAASWRWLADVVL